MLISSRSNGHTIPAFLIIILSIVLSFSEGFSRETGILSLPSGSRHIFIFLFFLLLFVFKYDGATINQNYFYSLCIVFIVGLIPAVLGSVPLVNGLMGMFMATNTFLIYFLAKNSKFTINEFLFFCRAVFIIFTISATFSLLNFLISDSSSMREHFGLFREAGAFATSINIAIIIGLFLFSINRKKFFLYMAIFLSLIVMLTIIKKSMASTFLIWLLWFLYNNFRPSSKLVYFGIISIFLIIGAAFLYEALFENVLVNIDYLDRVGVEGHVRIGMYLHGFQIASNHFPLGTGYGSFGSLASISFGYYSPVYYDYGTDLIGANSPADIARNSYTLLDTFWPHILAEIGFLGSIFYLYLFFFPLFTIKKLVKKNILLKPFVFITTAITLVLFWEGLTLYHPETPFFIFVLGGIQGLIHSIINKYCQASIN